MFWAKEIADKISSSQVINDSKTPSGRIHVGSLRGVVIHNEIYKALRKHGVLVSFYYGIDDMDPLDTTTSLSESDKEKYLGLPLFQVPSPKKDGAQNYAQYFADEFLAIFKNVDAHPKTYWMSKWYQSGKLNKIIKKILETAPQIRQIYKKVSGAKRSDDWLPLMVICQNCGKISNTYVFSFNNQKVHYRCLPEKVSWARGCGHEGKVSPFDGQAKLPWTLEWVAQWEILGVTIEGCGKDLATRGGSRDVADTVYREVFGKNPPLNIPYEHFIVGGRKMSSSRGFGLSAVEAAEILPPEVLQFLLSRTSPRQAIDFDPQNRPEVIPRLFDDYDRETNSNLPRLSLVAQWVQMPHLEEKLKDKKVKERAKYAKIWLERFAPEDQKFTVKEEFPEEALHLSGLQKIFLTKVGDELIKKWEPEEFEKELYKISQELGLSSKDAFSAVYLPLLGKDHGPKAAWLILSLDKKFVINRFKEALA